MDDYNIGSLRDSRNEYTGMLINILTPCILTGFKSMLAESIKVSITQKEPRKYLMIFQTVISAIPRWSNAIVAAECTRIKNTSGCDYLESLITAVHIIHVKISSAVRAGQKHKKIEVKIPKLDEFIHNTYIICAQKLYKAAHLFAEKLPSLQMQANYMEIEKIIQDCIIQAIRSSIPTETILRAYLAETTEEFMTEEVHEKIVEEPIFETKSAAQELVSDAETVAETPDQSLPSTSIEEKGEILQPLSFDDIQQVISSVETSNTDDNNTIIKVDESDPSATVTTQVTQPIEVEIDRSQPFIAGTEVSLDDMEFETL